MTSVQPGHVAQALSLVGPLCSPESAVGGGEAEPPSHSRIVGSLEQPGHFGGSVHGPRCTWPEVVSFWNILRISEIFILLHFGFLLRRLEVAVLTLLCLPR